MDTPISTLDGRVVVRISRLPNPEEYLDEALRVTRPAKAAPRGGALEKATLTPPEAAGEMRRVMRALALVSVLEKATGVCRARETGNRKPASARRFLRPRQLRPPMAHSKNWCEIETSSLTTRSAVAG